MATYIVGDIQGCFTSLAALLEEVGFGDEDHLWCVGDLVNRGPESLATMRFARDLGGRFSAVLGNHDLHFLAMVYGGHPHRDGDTMEELLAAPDCLELAEWMRRLPLLIEADDLLLTHAGIPHIWDLETARNNAREVEQVVRGPGHRAFFEALYGDEPSLWDGGLADMDRHRAIVNYFTRMRLISSHGRLEFRHKGGLSDLPAGYQPWFRHPPRVDKTILFGHWAALNGATGEPHAVGLDTGCVWGRAMTGMRLEDRQQFSVAAIKPRRASG